MTPPSKSLIASPDYWRQLDVFNPEAFNEEVHVIGVGATGSWIAYILAKMGVRKIHAWDFDTIEPHNLPNQVYGQQDVGKIKVEALASRLLADCGTEVVPHCEKVDGTQKISGIVFLCVDKMSYRRPIWEKAIKFNLNVKLMVETRLGAEVGIIHTVRPTNRLDVKGFDSSLFSDEDGEESACTYRAIATTVAAVAGLAAHKLVKFLAGEEISPVLTVAPAANQPHSNYEMLCIRPIVVTATDWGKKAKSTEKE